MPVLDHPVNGTVRDQRGERQPNLIRIIKTLRDDAMTLVRQEVALAKREVMGKVANMGKNAVFLGVGGVIAVFGLFFVLLALNNLIFAGLARAFSGATANWLAPALTGMSILIAALFLILKSLRGMRRSAPIPDRTLETLRDDKEWVKGKLK
jgi:hypothetical protein